MTPDWQKTILARGELYRVGGAVRDEVMGIAVTGDDDFVVRLIPPQELEALLEPYGKLSFVGRSFGVYKFTPAGGATVDIVYPRRERSVGPGHREFRVDWDPEMAIEEDLARRDFTINAIARSVRDDSLIDPCDGRRDIVEHRVRMIFDDAFREDPLRILRGVRFATRFDFEVEAATLARMRESVDLLDTLSPERVQEEFSALFTECECPSRGLRMLHDIGALAVVLPELDRCAGVEQNIYHPDDVFVHSLKTCDAAPREELAVRWAALLHDVGKVPARQTVRDESGERVVFYGHEHVGAEIARDVLGRLRYPRAFVRDVAVLVGEHMFHYVPDWKPATVRRFIRRVGTDRLEGLFRLREADSLSRDLTDEVGRLADLRRRVAEELASRRLLGVGDLAVDGSDVMEACGLGPGPAVGRILAALLERVTEDPALNTREALLDVAQELARSESTETEDGEAG